MDKQDRFIRDTAPSVKHPNEAGVLIRSRAPTEPIRIDYLANHRSWAPLLANWFQTEWQCFCQGRSLEDVTMEITAYANTDAIPMTLVALSGADVVGTVSLKRYDMDSRRELSPWLAGLCVVADRRKRGIAKSLVTAALQEAARLGMQSLYLYTPDAEQFYANLGWEAIESTHYQGLAVTIMQYRLADYHH